MAPNIGQPISNTAVPVDRMDCSNTYTEDQLIPLYGMIGKLQGLVDDRIHLHQAAGTTKVGFNVYCDHKLAHQLGLVNYSRTTGFRSLQVPSSRSPDPQTEVRGRLWEEEGKKRANKALELWRSKQPSRKSDKEKAGVSSPQSGKEGSYEKTAQVR